MWLLRKAKRAISHKPLADKAAHTIVGLFRKLQNAFACKMNNVFGNMNTRRLKMTVILFCIIFGGLSIYLIVNAVARPFNSQTKFNVDQLNVPRHFDKTGDKQTAQESLVDDETFEKINVFKNYMDSLKATKSYKYDSILSARPQLMDSVLMLEQIYYLQKQSKIYEK